MTFFALRRSLTAPISRKFAAYTAEFVGVSVEHLLEVVRARRRYRTTRKERLRSHRRVLEKNGKSRPLLMHKKRVSHEWLFAGEGRFHELLKLAGMTQEDFSKLAGITEWTVRHWYGYPLHGWAINLLELVVWKKNAMVKLAHHGYPEEMFRAGHLPSPPEGHYPKTKAQGRALIAALVPPSEE